MTSRLLLLRREDGQTTMEWLGVGAVIVAVLTLLATSGGDLATFLTSTVQEQVCDVTGGGCSVGEDGIVLDADGNPVSGDDGGGRGILGTIADGARTVGGGLLSGGGAFINGLVLGDYGGGEDSIILEGIRITGQTVSSIIVVGDIRDGVRAVQTGDEVSLGLILVGLIPVYGDGARAAGLIGESAVDATRAVDDVADIAADAGRSGDDVIRVADDVADACSFPGSTPVRMADGTALPIARIAIGDLVWSEDPLTGQAGPRRVTHVFRHLDDAVALDIEGHELVTTPDHPFWDAVDRRWTPAADLGGDARLLGALGEWVPTAGVTGPAGRMPMYNLEVADLHTYRVVAGPTDVLVHNDCLLALRNWQSRRFTLGSETFLLGKSDMDHILKRHHPEYWDGSTRPTQTFFDPAMSIQDVENAIAEVVRQNRDELIEIGDGFGQVRGVVDGVEYVLGVGNGHIGQFYPP
ncbi:polymorphic toxin-type HINT domain-containing protein [Euzebya tangerina]|uniref:polymorphic toxin-type HINT domain-containing protein n=1 Tax=Euzebya tangerina TaxID=591198 RepID=UPI0013C31CBD|nr:polymorphic toxin-type HINT domain-containing protein [Euzebya tangerina]